MVSALDVHEKRIAMRKASREEADAIMKLAGFDVLHVWELANSYWPDSPEYDTVRAPWWLFMTDIGPVQIGWRKKVLHIEWSACSVRAIVTDEEVTKAPDYVHAWSTEKAITYLRELRRRAALT